MEIMSPILSQLFSKQLYFIADSKTGQIFGIFSYFHTRDRGKQEIWAKSPSAKKFSSNVQIWVVFHILWLWEHRKSIFEQNSQVPRNSAVFFYVLGTANIGKTVHHIWAKFSSTKEFCKKTFSYNLETFCDQSSFPYTLKNDQCISISNSTSTSVISW